MRIAYLGQMADMATENGISKKIRTQACAWMQAGHTVRYFALRPTTHRWPGLVPLETEILPHGSPIQRVRNSHRLCRRIREWRPDLVYFRYAYHSPGLPGLFRTIPTVAEINSDDTTEYGLTLSWTKRLYHRFTRARVLAPIRAFAPVTHELAGRFASFARPTAVIGNSIDLRDFEPLPPCAPTDAPAMIFVGSPGTPWHGLARVAEIARMLPQVTIEVVGCSQEDWLAAGASGPPPNVHLHGVLTRERYEPLLRGASVALGTLGLFEKRMDEACPLKVREYLARGLPVIAAYQDTDIPLEADYFLRLPNDASALAPWRRSIEEFITRWQARRVPRSRIEHLDVAVKETLRLTFLERIVQTAHG